MEMNKKDIIAREILGWKSRGKNSWYNLDKDEFVHDSYFMPEKYLEHAMLIVNQLAMFGITYRTNGNSEARFDDIIGTGSNLPEAITNAAYSFIKNYYSSIEYKYMNQL